MQSFIVVASLVSELAGGFKMTPPPLVLNVTKNTLVLQGLMVSAQEVTQLAVYISPVVLLT